MTLVGRRELDHPALGTAGGAGLHTSIETIYTNIGDDLGGRFKSYSSVANSVVTNIKHNFGVAFSELNIFVYTGTFPNLTLATGYTVAVDGGNPKTHINVTTPGSGGPHTFAVFIAQGAIDASQIKAAVANASKFISYDGSGNVVATKDVPTGAVVGTTDTQTLTNKTVQQALVDDFLEFNEETSPATPASGKVRLYPKSDGKFYRKDDTGLEQVIGGGSGAGGINYLVSSSKAWDFEDSLTTGWSTYADAAATSPVDGTGGTANVTFAASASSPLRGLYSGLLTKDAANRQGQGVSVDFTLDSQDTGKPFTLNVDCNASAAYTGSSGTEYARAFVYDVTNAALLPGYIDIAPGSSTCKGFFLATTSTSYRLIFHVAGTGASAWTLKVDNVTPGQLSLGFGVTVTDAVSSTISQTSFGTTTNNSFFYNRVGDKMTGRATWKNGTVVASAVSITLPSGINIDDSKMFASDGQHIVGRAQRIRTGGSPASAQIVDVFYDGASTTQLFFSVASASDALTKSNGGDWASNNDYVYVEFSIPIVGWSSNIITGDRAVEEFAYNSSTSTSASDTTSFASGASGAQIQNITAALSRRVRFQTPIQPTDSIIVEVKPPGSNNWLRTDARDETNNVLGFNYYYQNGATYGVGQYRPVSGSSTDIDVAFGQYAFPSGTYGAAGQAWSAGGAFAGGAAFWRVRKIAGGALVGFPIDLSNITNKHVMVARMSGTQSTAAATDVKVAFDTVEIDTSGTYSTVNRRYTIPVSGMYRVHIYFNVDSVTAASALFAKLYKNATTFVHSVKWEIPSSGLQNPIQLTWVGSLVAGDFLEAYVRHDDGSARNITFTALSNTPIFTVERVT